MKPDAGASVSGMLLTCTCRACGYSRVSRVGQIGMRISALLLLAWKPWVMRTNSIHFSDAPEKVKMSTTLTSQGCVRIKTGTAHSRVPGLCDANRTNDADILQVLCQRHRGHCVRARSLQSYPTLCDPIDCSPPGPFVHGILQARILDWIAMLSSRGSS